MHSLFNFIVYLAFPRVVSAVLSVPVALFNVNTVFIEPALLIELFLLSMLY